MNPKVGLRSLPQLPGWVKEWVDNQCQPHMTRYQSKQLAEYALEANEALEQIKEWVKQYIAPHLDKPE